MKVIGGIHRLDGGRTDRAAVKRMHSAAQLVFPSHRRFWIADTVGLVQASRRRDVCFFPDTEPRNKDHRGAVVVFDGCLDNRRELIGELRCLGVGARSDDPELTLAAYEAWGDDCASKLVGDFAFGLWDSGRRRLLCVRDPLGVRPLYVLIRRELVCFATQLRQILAVLQESPPFDLEFVADRLAHGVDRADADCTPYRGVSRLRPGHRLVAEHGRVRIERYWEWRIPDAESARSHKEYVERFRQTFLEAVESRMCGADEVWADVSGGLDSSSIASVAAQRSGGSRVRTVSVVFNASTLSDERKWSTAVAGANRVEQHCIDGDAHHPLSRLREAVAYWEEPHAASAFFGVHERYGRLLAGAGVPTLLTGIGAEAVVMSKRQVPVHLADLLRRGRIGQLWREIDRWQRVLKIPLSNLVWRYCVRPLANRPLVSCDWLPDIHDWVERSFARGWDLRARATRAGMPRFCRGVADQWQVEAVGRITGFLLRGYLEKSCDIRYPFLHRPLVELALGTPWSLKAVPGEPKALLRRAMRGVLPEEVRRRTQYTSMGHAVYAGLRKEFPILEQIVASSLLVDLGVVNRERLQYALQLARQGHAFDLGGLLSTLTLDAWLQHAAHKGDASWLGSAV